MQKLLLICPTYGNTVEALSVHTKIMSSYFKRAGEIIIMTSKEASNQGKADSREIKDRLIEISGAWNLINLAKKFKEIIAFNPDTIFIQYVPFLYGRGGINFSFPLWVLFLRIFFKYRIEIYFHELYYPFEMKMKSILMNVSHIIMLLVLGTSAHHILVTTKDFEKQMKRILFFKKYICWLPVGPNIEKYKVDQKACDEFRRKNNISSTDIVLGSFGTFHPSKNYQLIFDILKKIKTEEKVPVKFIMIGQNEAQLLEYLGAEDFKQLKGMVITTGKLDDLEVNVAFAVMDLYLGYFVDGLSSRRGSIMAAMQAGLPIISTLSKTTEGCFIQQAHIYLYDPDEKIFFDAVKELIKHYGYSIKKHGKILHPVFEEWFAWEKIFQTYEKFTSQKG